MKVVIIYNSVAPHGPAAASARQTILDRLRIPHTKRLITIVANLNLPVKDHPTFLRAAQIVAASCPEAVFVIVGQGGLTSAMQVLAADLGIEGQTYFVGFCDDVYELLEASEVGALTSLSEGLPNSVLEYMLAGLPVVATDVGGVSEAVADGETGYLVPAGDSCAVADRILRLLRNPAHAKCMGERGKSAVLQKFSPEAQLDKTVGLYENLLKEAGAHS